MKNVCHAIVISSAEAFLDIWLCKQNHYLIIVIGSNQIELRSEDEEQELLHWNVIQLNSSGHSPSHPPGGWHSFSHT